MSLLPSEIVPFTQPLGFVEIESKDGSKRYEVQISKNWWLLFYNIVKNSLGMDGGIPAEALALVDGADTDASVSDALQAYRLIVNARLEQEPLPESTRDFVNALLFGDALLPDPAPRAQPFAAITVGASPYTYTASADGSVAVTGGTVTGISVIRQGTTVATGVTAGVIPLSRLDQIQVTYSVVPTMNFLPR
jgi:hypothetical protein